MKRAGSHGVMPELPALFPFIPRKGAGTTGGIPPQASEHRKRADFCNLATLEIKPIWQSC